jgi:hypothetical protein
MHPAIFNSNFVIVIDKKNWLTLLKEPDLSDTF